MSTDKIRHVGKADIHIAPGVVLKPNSVTILPSDLAQKLRRLYPNILLGEDQALDPFKVADTPTIPVAAEPSEDEVEADAEQAREKGRSKK